MATKKEPVGVQVAKITLIGTIVVAVIGLFGDILGYWQLSNKTKVESSTHTGHVFDANTLDPIPRAKITVYIKDITQIAYTDSEGVYQFNLPSISGNSGQVRVDAQGYDIYTRNIIFSPNLNQIEDIRLVGIKSVTVPETSTVIVATPNFETPAPIFTPNISQTGGGLGHIVFSAKDEDGDLEIYFLDIFKKESKPIKLTSNAVPDLDPIWSPDGKKIAFVSSRDGNPDIFIMNFDGSNPMNVTNSSEEDYSPAWSPDGEKIVFSTNLGNTEIHKINITAQNLVRLTNINSFDKEPSVATSFVTGLNFVVFQSNRRNSSYSELYTMLLDGSEEKILMPNRQRQWDTSPSFSPDGKKIVFVSSKLGQNEIFLVNADGTNIQQLTFTNHIDEYSPSWSPDSSHIIFSSSNNNVYTIYRMDIDGSNLTQIIEMEDANYPSWKP